MIFTFRFISDEEDSFVLDVNINHDQTFEQLHQSIQKILNYDATQLASFFIANNDWEKQQEISLMEMGDDTSVALMSNTKIEEFYNSKDQRILYVFDYFNERLFFGSVVRTIDAESPIELPSVSKLEGKIPEQMSAQADNMDELEFDFDDSLPDDFEELPEDFEELDPNNY